MRWSRAGLIVGLSLASLLAASLPAASLLAAAWSAASPALPHRPRSHDLVLAGRRPTRRVDDLRSAGHPLRQRSPRRRPGRRCRASSARPEPAGCPTPGCWPGGVWWSWCTETCVRRTSPWRRQCASDSLSSAGEVIGQVEGQHAGCALPCLHWGLLRGEVYLNPLSLLHRGPSRLLPVPAPAAGGTACRRCVRSLPRRPPAAHAAGRRERPSLVFARRAFTARCRRTAGAAPRAGTPGARGDAPPLARAGSAGSGAAAALMARGWGRTGEHLPRATLWT